MALMKFVDIVLQEEGISIPSVNHDNVARNCMRDHNYNLQISNHPRQNKQVWQRNEVMRLTNDESDKHKLIHVSDDDEEEEDEEEEMGRRMKRGGNFRKLHNTLEKERRAKERGYLQSLRDSLPCLKSTPKRCSKDLIINCAIKHIIQLQRKNKDIERELNDVRVLEGMMVETMQESFVRAASNLSNDSGAFSGIINSEDDDEVDVA